MTEADREPVTVTLLSIERVRGAGKLAALAAVEITISGVVLTVAGFRVLDEGRAWRIEPPAFRDHMGRWQDAIGLPATVLQAIGELIRDELAAAVTPVQQARHMAFA